jgi:hypothetical protein
MGRIYRGSFPRVIPLATSKASRAITTIYNGHIGIQKLLSERGYTPKKTAYKLQCVC